MDASTVQVASVREGGLRRGADPELEHRGRVDSWGRGSVHWASEAVLLTASL